MMYLYEQNKSTYAIKITFGNGLLLALIGKSKYHNGNLSLHAPANLCLATAPFVQIPFHPSIFNVLPIWGCNLLYQLNK